MNSPGSNSGSAWPVGCPRALTTVPEAAAVYDVMAPLLLRYGTAMTRNSELARDGLQETFLRYLVARSEGIRIENPRGWLFRVLHNCLVDRIDRAAILESIPLEGLNLPDPAADRPELEADQLSRSLADRLSARELQCLLLRAEGLSYEEIGAGLAIRPGTVGAFLHRAVKKAKSALSASPAARRQSARERRSNS